MKGIFPCIVVEECRWDGEPLSPEGEEEEIEEDEEEVSESGILPPSYTPPEIPSHLLPPEKVIVTQPTPTVEHTSPKKDADGSSGGEGGAENESTEAQDKFAMEMSGDQQQKYQTQFDEEDEGTNSSIPSASIVVSEVPGKIFFPSKLLPRI